MTKRAKARWKAYRRKLRLVAVDAIAQGRLDRARCAGVDRRGRRSYSARRLRNSTASSVRAVTTPTTTRPKAPASSYRPKWFMLAGLTCLS